MEITITVPDILIREAAHQAIQNAFRLRDERWNSGGGVGTNEIIKQTEEWAKQQDYSVLIAELAPKVTRSVVQSTLATSLQAAVKAEIKTIKENGELGEIIKRTVRETFVSA